LDESHKLDPWPLDAGPRPKSGKLRLNLHATILERKSIGSKRKRINMAIVGFSKTQTTTLDEKHKF
jgi:hypothetical protein